MKEPTEKAPGSVQVEEGKQGCRGKESPFDLSFQGGTKHAVAVDLGGAPWRCISDV